MWSERHVGTEQRSEKYNVDGFEDVGKWPQSKEFRKNLDMGKARELIDYI